MARRSTLPEEVVTKVLVSCRRRCCLCYYLDDDRRRQKGQIAHINQRADDPRIENLVYLCLAHHDEFDSSTSQSKGLTKGEVHTYRDRMIAELGPEDNVAGPETREAARELISDAREPARHRWRHMWRFPLWLQADQPELYAFTTPSADGVCAIERIDLPDGHIVIACMEVPGNPGTSITNCAKALFDQVCERFRLDPHRIIWLENYITIDPETWREVRFVIGSDGTAGEPQWGEVSNTRWRALRLSPKRRWGWSRAGRLGSRLTKNFAWPPVDTMLPAGD